MYSDEKRAFIAQLDRSHRRGGVLMTDWAAYLMRAADEAYVRGKYRPCVVTSANAAESFLQYFYAGTKKVRLAYLIDEADLRDEVRRELRVLRRARREYLHPDPEAAPPYPEEMECRARHAVTTIRRLIYDDGIMRMVWERRET